MAGSEGGHGFAAGAQDLLRQATQAMMSSNRSASAEDDATDHIDSDTPQSGIATPQPDLSDKRVPGIMHSDNYFNQVGSGSSNSSSSGALETPALGSEAMDPLPVHRREENVVDREHRSAAPVSNIESGGASDAAKEDAPSSPSPGHTESPPLPAAGPQLLNLHPYPTPPASNPPSVHKLKLSDSIPEGAGADDGTSPPRSAASASTLHRKSISESIPSKARKASLWSPLSSVVTTSNVHASDFSNPTECLPATTSASPIPSGVSSDSPANDTSREQIQRLTDDAPRDKSNSPTPTRALSNQTASSDVSNGSEKANGKNAALRIDSVTSGSADESVSQAQLKGIRGKLTVKIAEARGLRRSRDPYVVAIFQRNELLSKGPRSEEEEDEDIEVKSPVGGIPISRQGSESGRSMAIPMRSRQSSSTSLTDYRDFKRKGRGGSMTNPKWDTEAVFDVVGSDSHLNLTIYDRGSASEDFLGSVDFQPQLSEQNPSPIHGWFPLEGRKDTQAQMTGEIYVEITFQRTEKKHYGPEDFTILKLIGKGTFGQVYQVRKKDTKRIYAMKVLQKKVIVQKKEVAHTVGERNILVRTAMADSPFIVGLKFSFQTPSDLYLVTDYMSGGELFWHLQKEGRFDETRAKFYIAELILALQHLHMHDIVYRDLKPENILLDANGHIALCDFGLSKANLTKNDTTNTFCGTTEYLAPEVLLDEAGYTKMVDFWSLGVLVFEMCCGWSPFYAEDTQQMYKNIAFGKVRFPRDTLTTEGRNFVKGLLNRNPKHRLGAVDDAEELKRHPFFADIDWEALAKKSISPPFKPKLKSETDTSNFDPEFTNALNGASSLNARAAALAAGVATSTPLSPGMQANFKGFTFVDENSIDENMRGRVKDDYDEMDEDEKREQDWEDPFDVGDKRGSRDDRMSGVVKTNTNEDSSMFNGGHFDM
ncbi:MAG: hypothetical protein M1818_005482 [Claussenomyces sp. TS43310]|nr:MAG: hypothetical protein M1818_005482 [Claussenomyces sp. TS43310]